MAAEQLSASDKRTVGGKRTASERDDDDARAACAALPSMRLTTIVGNRKAGSKRRAADTGPVNAPEETGILLSGTIKGIWADGAGRLHVVSSITGQTSITTVDLAAPHRRTRTRDDGREMYRDPLVLAGDRMYFGGLLYRGTYASSAGDACFQFAKGIDILMAIADAAAGYLVGLTYTARSVGCTPGPRRLRIVRLTADACAEWQQGDAPTEPWMAAMDALLGDYVVVADWQFFAQVYEQLRRIFHAAHQRQACFEATISINMHLNEFPAGSHDVVRCGRDTYMRPDELPGLLLPGVRCSLSQRGWDSTNDTTPEANIKGNNGLHILASGDVLWTEAHCLRRYSGYYAPFGTDRGATQLPDLPEL